MVSIGPARYTGPSSDFYADAWVESQGTNHSHVRVAVRAYVGPAGSTGSYYNGWGQHWAGFDNYGVVVNHSANPFMPSGYGQGAKRWEDVGYIDFTHDANGYHGNVTLRMHVEYGGINQEFTATLSFPRIPKVPSPTINGSVSEPSPTSLKYRFEGNGDGGPASSAGKRSGRPRVTSRRATDRSRPPVARRFSPVWCREPPITSARAA
jgi:hypothetical protein